MPFIRLCGKILQNGAGHGWQYGACVMHVGYLRLQIHKQFVQYSLLSHCNNGSANFIRNFRLVPMSIWLRSNLSKKFAVFCRTCTLASVCHQQAFHPVKNKATFLLGSFDTREVTTFVTPVQMSYIPGISRNCKEALISTKDVSYHSLSVPRAVELTTLGNSYSPS